MTFAALYMMETIDSSFEGKEAVLYEGFVSFKQGATDHAADAGRLRKAVYEGASTIGGRVVAPEQLARTPTDTLHSPFNLMGLDVGIPPVICSFS